MPQNPVFHSAEAVMPQRRAMAERAMNRFPGTFLTTEIALDYLANITTPASGRWPMSSMPNPAPPRPGGSCFNWNSACPCRSTSRP